MPIRWPMRAAITGRIASLRAAHELLVRDEVASAAIAYLPEGVVFRIEAPI
ncbi:MULTISPECIES: hypothetical protein [unclassified Sphingomonas]|jgi:hypothetical protein|uniref:hypothetical protein n=1 Tax=unclassified Sphingomonas TaxID=196159 RepID=UPI001E32EEEF|nr:MULTISPECIES: hypothetical protein [unclassified Sphingomonas]